MKTQAYCHSCHCLVVEGYSFYMVRSGIADGKCPLCGVTIQRRC